MKISIGVCTHGNKLELLNRNTANQNGRDGFIHSSANKYTKPITAVSWKQVCTVIFMYNEEFAGYMGHKQIFNVPDTYVKFRKSDLISDFDASKCLQSTQSL